MGCIKCTLKHSTSELTATQYTTHISHRAKSFSRDTRFCISRIASDRVRFDESQRERNAGRASETTQFGIASRKYTALNRLTLKVAHACVCVSQSKYCLAYGNFMWISSCRTYPTSCRIHYTACPHLKRSVYFLVLCGESAPTFRIFCFLMPTNNWERERQRKKTHLMPLHKIQDNIVCGASWWDQHLFYTLFGYIIYSTADPVSVYINHVR